MAIGLVLAGAEPEEMVTAIFASGRHLPGIAAGDAIGNVTMLTVVGATMSCTSSGADHDRHRCGSES